jgi:hypothetical protein
MAAGSCILIEQDGDEVLVRAALFGSGRILRARYTAPDLIADVVDTVANGIACLFTATGREQYTSSNPYAYPNGKAEDIAKSVIFLRVNRALGVTDRVFGLLCEVGSTL